MLPAIITDNVYEDYMILDMLTMKEFLLSLHDVSFGLRTKKVYHSCRMIVLCTIRLIQSFWIVKLNQSSTMLRRLLKTLTL